MGHMTQPTVSKHYSMQYTVVHKIHTYIPKNESKHSEMGPVSTKMLKVGWKSMSAMR